MAFRIAELERPDLTAAERVLRGACAFDRAAEVAEEKLFAWAPAEKRPGAPSPRPATAFGAWIGDALVGVAAVSARWLRVLAVEPGARGQGVGSALLETCEREARVYLDALEDQADRPRMRVLDQPGSYLAPGVDVRNEATIAWLEKRGYERGKELRHNVLVDVRGNPRVTPDRLAASIASAGERGYEVRRARRDERTALTQAIAAEFGGVWDFEVERALGFLEHPGVHVAVKDGAYCAFAAHDGNNRSLGWFGPTGTWPAHRGQGLGEATLLACLVDVAESHPQCEVAWIGPRPFYDKVAGVASDRYFVTLTKVL